MFVDTNVLVNSRILEAPQHAIARLHLERAFSDDEPLTISRQVIREYLAVVTRPQNWPVPITYDEALEDVSRLLSTYELLEDGPVVTDRLLELCRSVPAGGKQIPRRQHRGDDAGIRRAETVNAQCHGLSSLRRPD